MEMVFVGQCEVFACLGFVEIISFLYVFPWPRSSQVRKRGVNSLKTLIFLTTLPLSDPFLLSHLSSFLFLKLTLFPSLFRLCSIISLCFSSPPIFTFNPWNSGGTYIVHKKSIFLSTPGIQGLMAHLFHLFSLRFSSLNLFSVFLWSFSLPAPFRHRSIISFCFSFLPVFI